MSHLDKTQSTLGTFLQHEQTPQKRKNKTHKKKCLTTSRVKGSSDENISAALIPTFLTPCGVLSGNFSIFPLSSSSSSSSSVSAEITSILIIDGPVSVSPEKRPLVRFTTSAMVETPLLRFAP